MNADVLTAEQRFAAYARKGPCIGTWDRGRDGRVRVYEMLEEELQLKFIAVPEDPVANVLPFFTLDGMRDHARRHSWQEIAP